MNKIYIIDDNYQEEVILNFEKNTFNIQDISYKFEIISKDKLLIFWTDSKEVYYTRDSYLYFLDTKYYLRFIIKKIFLINNDWNDQAIINLDTKKLNRIKYNDQFGKFSINHDNDKLFINWDRWGVENYIKNDEYTYISENYNILKKNILNIIPEIHIFIHICAIYNWKNIFSEQINTIKKTGLYDIITKIHLGILGEINIIKNDIFNDIKFNILYIDTRSELYEIHTINFIKSFCSNINNEIYILYIHTKGVRKAGNESVIESWREMMEYFLINNYKECIDNLDYFDSIGNNLVNLYCSEVKDISINKNHTYHYSGNFWWSKKSYIDKLDYISLDLTKNSINTRYKAENWILSLYPECKIGILFQDDTNTHPYHRYIFDYYKDLKIIIKENM